MRVNDVQTTKEIPVSAFFDGQHWAPRSRADNIRSAKAMIPRADDVFICTYPKSGTTWIQHIVHQLMDKAEYEMKDDENGNVGQNKINNKDMMSISPMIEQAGAAYANQLKSPRILKSHFTYKDMPKGGGAKYIYCCRNPKDVLTRLRVAYGDYFDNLLSWLDGIERKEEDILLLKYEELVADLHSAVISIGNFLGGKAAEKIKDAEKLAQIVDASTISSMKKNQERWIHRAISIRGEFIRKGGSRDWKNLLSYEQSNTIDVRFRERCTGTLAAEWWQTEMEWNTKARI